MPEAPQVAAPGAAERFAALAQQKKAEAEGRYSAVVSGDVEDQSGAEMPGALLIIHGVPEGDRAVVAAPDGSYEFTNMPAGNYTLFASYPGFQTRAVSLTVSTGEVSTVPTLILPITSFTGMTVTATQHDIATTQVKMAEQQRVLGVFPNFYISYLPDAAPLSAGQKFNLALRSTVDPVNFALTGVVAGIEQGSNEFSGYGQGAAGFAKRYGAAYADGAISTMLAGALLPSVLHQDPRYFWRGTGSFKSRAWYAVTRVVVCKGDSGHWQPNYSNVFGNLMAAGISNAYYPASDRNGAGLTVKNSLIGTVSGAAANIYQEFFSRHMTPATKKEPIGMSTPIHR